MHPLLQGIILGFTLATLLGPALFTLLQTSINRGMKSGLFLALGIFLSDVSVVVLAYLGALQLLNQKQNYLIAGIIGGLILIGFGLYTFYHKVHINDDTRQLEVKAAGPLTYILKGYFLNIMNPFVWFFWISAMVTVSSNYGDDKHGVATFFVGTLATVLLTDVLKVFISHKIRQRLNVRLLATINHILGVVLIGFGLFLIVRAIIHL